MKSLLVTVMVVLAAVAQAKSKKVDLDEKVQFNNLSAVEAFASTKYEKTIWTIQMPGTATWVNPAYGLCTDGQMVTTTHPVKTCLKWSANDDGNVKTFNSKHDADVYGNNVQCVASKSEILSSPISYSKEECVLWGVKTDDLGVKTFKYLASAKDFADSDDAVSNATPYCINKAVVAKKVATTYNVDFYLRNTKMGTHTYSVKACNNSGDF